jgi:hypothetical protein
MVRIPKLDDFYYLVDLEFAKTWIDPYDLKSRQRDILDKHINSNKYIIHSIIKIATNNLEEPFFLQLGLKK